MQAVRVKKDNCVMGAESWRAVGVHGRGHSVCGWRWGGEGRLPGTDNLTETQGMSRSEPGKEKSVLGREEHMTAQRLEKASEYTGLTIFHLL